MKLWMSPEEVADVFGLNVRRVRALASENAILAKKTGPAKQNHLLVNRESVERWIASLPDASSV